jgi:hypothetical protein
VWLPRYSYTERVKESNIRLKVCKIMKFRRQNCFNFIVSRWMTQYADSKLVCNLSASSLTEFLLSWLHELSYPVTCLNLAQYVVHVIYATALSDKITIFLHKNCNFLLPTVISTKFSLFLYAQSFKRLEFFFPFTVQHISSLSQTSSSFSPFLWSTYSWI